MCVTAKKKPTQRTTCESIVDSLIFFYRQTITAHDYNHISLYCSSPCQKKINKKSNCSILNNDIFDLVIIITIFFFLFGPLLYNIIEQTDLSLISTSSTVLAVFRVYNIMMQYKHSIFYLLEF